MKFNIILNEEYSKFKVLFKIEEKFLKLNIRKRKQKSRKNKDVNKKKNKKLTKTEKRKKRKVKKLKKTLITFNDFEL